MRIPCHLAPLTVLLPALLLAGCDDGPADGDGDADAGDADADSPTCDPAVCAAACAAEGFARGTCDEAEGECRCSGDPGGPWSPRHAATVERVDWEAGCLSAEPADLLVDLLESSGIERPRFGFTETDWDGGDYMPMLSDVALLPWFYEVQHSPLVVPCFAAAVEGALDEGIEGGGPATTAIAVAAALLGTPVRSLDDPPAPADVDHPLAEAVSTLVAAAGGDPDDEALAEAASGVPAEVQAVVAPVVRAMVPVVEARETWLAAYDLPSPPILFGQVLAYPLPLLSALDLTDQAVIDFLHGAERADLLQAAYDLAATVEAMDWDGVEGGEASFLVETPVGTVIVGGGGNDAYDEARHGTEIALLVDLGGDDVYRVGAGATRSHLNPVSVLVDIAGEDFYGYEVVEDPDDTDYLPPSDGPTARRPAGESNGPFTVSDVPRQGAGVLGAGLLFDLGTEGDTYRSLRASQGAGLGGVGVLVDGGGADSYGSEASSQGAAYWGVGALVDLGDGNDERTLFHEGQGFGYVSGVGILWDGGGDDGYLADIGDPALGGHPVYYSPQRPMTGNSSFTGGAGFGRRGDGDGAFLSGGVGVLRDRGEGYDTYTTSVFGLGTGYWQGTGLLLDDGGDDQYDGLWFVLGGAAHYALGALFDRGGNDGYGKMGGVVGVNMGSGHDYSVGLLWDGGGNDVYESSALGLGTGNCNGIGLFVDASGTDAYRSTSGGCCGYARTSSECDGRPGRQVAATMGYFLDAGGIDLYGGVPDGEGREGTVTRADGTLWILTGTSEFDVNEHGGGHDGEGGAGVTLP